MQTAPIKLPFITLLLMISFASVNAVLFTPALPDIAAYFHVGKSAQFTVTIFLIGYALGQLIYGPFANRYGRKPSLYIGIILQILSSFLCAYSYTSDQFSLLVTGRFLLALGSGVGLKMTFTIVNECFEPVKASQKISYLILSFGITPAISIAIGGFLNTQFGWVSCFYAGIIYGCILLFLCSHLPETNQQLDKHALNVKHLIHNYYNQFTNKTLMIGGFLMGSATAFIYLFAAIGPFIAIKLLHLNSTQYGLANLIPSLGLILGCILSAKYVKKYSLFSAIQVGIIITTIGSIILLLTLIFHLFPIIGLFIPMMIVFLGISFILPNASTIALTATADKAHGSAAMNFMNLGITTVAVVTVSIFHVTFLLLPFIFCIISLIMFIVSRKLNH